jgi:hypothetical protein
MKYILVSESEFLFNFLVVLCGNIGIAIVAFRKGYEKRSKELETDFDFNKKNDL